MPQITNYFHKATPEEVADQSAQSSESIRQFRAWNSAQKQSDSLGKAKREKSLSAARQQKFRLKQREMDVKLGLRDPVTHRKIKVHSALP